MVRYEPPSVASRCCLPLVHGLRRPFKPKIVRLLLSVLFWVLTFAWMIICGNLVTFRYPTDNDQLPDLLFDMFPSHKVYPLPEIFFYILLVSAVGRMIFHSDGVAIARRFAAIAGCIYILRSLTLIATSLPDPELRCQATTPSWRFSALIIHTCGDMVGHTVNLALAALVWSQYTKHSIVSVIAWSTSITTMILFVVNRSHYTIDVLISLFIAVFCWKYYHITLLLPSELQNPIVKWLEKLDFGASLDEKDIVKREGGISLPSVSLPSVNLPSVSLPSVNLPSVSEVLGNAGPSKYQELVDDNSCSPIPSKYQGLLQSSDNN